METEILSVKMSNSSSSDINTKYQKLAAEYSKLRSQAQVLKKCYFDEQARANEHSALCKEFEQRLRKTDLEIESLTFRNQQLTKRISVLQEDLNVVSKQKNKGKLIPKENSYKDSLLDEELQNKIIENTYLLSSISDKDLEINILQSRLSSFETQLSDQKIKETEIEYKYKSEIASLKNKIVELSSKVTALSNNPTPEPSLQNGDVRSEISSLLGSEDAVSSAGDSQLSEQLVQAKQQIIKLKQELEHWKAQSVMMIYNGDKVDTFSTDAACDSPGASSQISKLIETTAESIKSMNEEGDTKLSDYFMQRIDELIAERELEESRADSVSVECSSLQARLEDMIKYKLEVEAKLQVTEESLQSLQEELSTTSHNYEIQLSTMSDHLANMNEKLTAQCDEIQHLKYQQKEKRKFK